MKSVVFGSMLVLALSSLAHAEETTCSRTVEIIGETCHLNYDDRGWLRNIADVCAFGQSENHNGSSEGHRHTTVQVIVNKRTGNAVVVDTAGRNRCDFEVFDFKANNRSNVAYVQAIDGFDRSDKLFFRAEDGGLFVMDMGHHVSEVRNLNGRRMHIKALGKDGLEGLRLYREGGEFYDYSRRYAASGPYYDVMTFSELRIHSKTELTDRDLTKIRVRDFDGVRYMRDGSGGPMFHN